MPEHSQCWGIVTGAGRDRWWWLRRGIKGRERDEQRRKKKNIIQGNPDPGLSRALLTPRSLLLFTIDLKQPLNVGLCFGWLRLPNFLLVSHASWSGTFQSQPLLIPTLCIPFAWLASPLGTTDPHSSHPCLCDQHLTCHIAIPFITVSPHSALVVLIWLLSAFACLVLKQGVHQLVKGEDGESKELLLK